MTTLPNTKIPVSNGVNESFIYDEKKIKNNIDDVNNTAQLNGYSLIVSNATAKWMKNQTVNSIEDISLTVRSDGLVAIIGPVGAGKV